MSLRGRALTRTPMESPWHRRAATGAGCAARRAIGRRRQETSVFANTWLLLMVFRVYGEVERAQRAPRRIRGRPSTPRDKTGG